MKKITALILCAIIIFSLCSCSKIETVQSSAVESIAESKAEESEVILEGITDIARLEDGVDYVAKLSLATVLKQPTAEYSIAQGCYYNGEIFVTCYYKNLTDGKQVVLISENDSEGNVIKQSSPGLELDHANNITYIEKQNAYLVSHCQGTADEDYYTYSLVDADSLEIIKTEVLEYPFFSMAYCPEMDMFASGEWGGQTIDIWDGNLNHIKSIDVETPKSLSQGVCCNENGIYFIRSSQNGSITEIRVYDWDGNFIRSIKVDTYNETESINIIGGRVYISTCGGNIYTARFVKA